ncbi:hypothetical protein H5J25_00145 [Sphingomonas aliaeris]|uniref:PaaX family transcriptional regulator n=1 Tax=Sphingomonas aliaeris TaxID=2759526 RepID=A0A974NUS3_9SPHN|nr:hypothetical protein [Sphingomonas aliaeris]QQV77300.1 hypothetical protein H5J25_00145 [Sphingomonas aliaeris]
MTPKSLALWFLSTAAPAPLRAGTLIDRARIFDIEPSAVRVALGRLVRDGLADQTERGLYSLGPKAAALHVKARKWLSVEDGVRQWDGAWIVVLTHHLGRINRPRLQAGERSLRLTGFAEAGAGAWVRPDNLSRETSVLAGELEGLGLDAGATILGGCIAQPFDDARFRTLWSRGSLEESYRFWIDEMEASELRTVEMSVTEAARETFLLGQSVIRAINSDPLLPAELVDTDLRRTLVDTMIGYNAMALRHWSKVK